ncbi:MAG: hypothetical protein ACRC78_11050, partial [Planktothrix sp.]
EPEPTLSEPVELIVEPEPTPSEPVELIVEPEPTVEAEQPEPIASEIPPQETTLDVPPEPLAKQLGGFFSRFRLQLFSPVQVTSNSPTPLPEIADQVPLSEPIIEPQESENINPVPELLVEEENSISEIEDSTPELTIKTQVITEETQTVDIE